MWRGCSAAGGTPRTIGVGVLFFLGALIGWWLEKRDPAVSEEFTFPVASGWIAGESLMGVGLVMWENAPELINRLLGR